MERLLPIASGLDIHKDIIEACIIKHNGYDGPVVERGTFTTLRGGLMELREWLMAHGCPNVAMESTGVFWRPVYELLEGPGMNLTLVNSRHMKNLPGRKTDVKDAEWIAQLHLSGLLDGSYVPEKGIRDLREHARHYRKSDQDRVRSHNRLEKHLQAHGFKLSSVINDITGVSGMRILNKLCGQGEVGIEDVRACLARGVRKSAEEIAYAINGRMSEHPRALLRLQLDILHAHGQQKKVLMGNLESAALPYERQIGLLCGIPGIGWLAAVYIIAEIGVDMALFAVGPQWKDKSARIASWAGLCPRNDQSAGKIMSAKTMKGNNYVKTILVQCAHAAVKTRGTRLSNWYWRNAGRLGQKKAIIAVARKLLCYVFHILSTGMPYNDQLDKDNAEKIIASKLESAINMVSKSIGGVPATGGAIHSGTLDVKATDIILSLARQNGVLHQGQKSPVLPQVESTIPTTAKKRGRPKKTPAVS
jgi:transposase